MPTSSMPSVSTSSDLSDVVDSYYIWVKTRILALNPTRKFRGIIQALDWPFKQAELETLYLAIVTDNPGKAGTPSSPVYTTRLQWVYLIQGTDIQPGQQVANRSKYRANNKIKQELIHGNFPQFCERTQLQEVGTIIQQVSYYPLESIWWNQIAFKDRVDKTSGILFGEGTLQVTSFAPTILA